MCNKLFYIDIYSIKRTRKLLQKNEINHFRSYWTYESWLKILKIHLYKDERISVKKLIREERLFSNQIRNMTFLKGNIISHIWFDTVIIFIFIYVLKIIKRLEHCNGSSEYGYRKLSFVPCNVGVEWDHSCISDGIFNCPHAMEVRDFYRGSSVLEL